MRSEMDILKMTTLQKFYWLRASRATLLLVGVVWIGMIVVQLGRGHRPWFLIVMVPVFALFRFVAYRFYQKTV